jgi:hypothetical protein
MIHTLARFYNDLHGSMRFIQAWKAGLLRPTLLSRSSASVRTTVEQAGGISVADAFEALSVERDRTDAGYRSSILSLYNPSSNPGVTGR